MEFALLGTTPREDTHMEEDLRKENAQLRAENESMREAITRVREFIQVIRTTGIDWTATRGDTNGN